MVFEIGEKIALEGAGRLHVLDEFQSHWYLYRVLGLAGLFNIPFLNL